jgi:hypothetical protein
MYCESEGTVKRTKGALLRVLGDIASSSAGQKATRAAEELYSIIVKPPEGSIFKIACEDVTGTVSLHVALVATFLAGLSEQEVTSLDRFCFPNSTNNMPANANTPNGVARIPTTSSASTVNYNEMGGLVTEKEYAALKLKHEEHDRMIQYIKSKDATDGFEIDVGGGLKQMLIPKKSDEESEVIDQDASIEKRMRDLEVLVDVLIE